MADRDGLGGPERLGSGSGDGMNVSRQGWHDPAVPERFEERKPRVIAVFGDDDGTIRAVAHVIELMEMAWHDCYAEITPSEEVVEDVLLCSGGTLGD